MDLYIVIISGNPCQCGYGFQDSFVYGRAFRIEGEAHALVETLKRKNDNNCYEVQRITV